jgi:noranthrone monooxygenase
MMNISLLVVPVLLDTAAQPLHLVDQWVRVYHYGHQVMPALAITTCLLYAYAVRSKRSAGRPWRVYALAGVITFTMIPFTWIVMAATNNLLFAAQVNGKAGKVTALDEVFRLIKQWTILHTTRALLPLTGAGIGMLGTLRDASSGKV